MKINALDRALLAVAPKMALSRLRARAVAETLARHYEAAAVGRRTQNWQRRTSDANAAAGADLWALRALARDLVRNNAWARNAVRVITRNVVGYGIAAKPVGFRNLARRQQLMEAWRAWAESTACDAAGRLTFSGLQKLATRCIVESGEVLVRRRWRRPEDALALPMQLQVLEPDFIDTAKNGIPGTIAGSKIIHGIEFDAIDRRIAYWLFEEHPGSIRAVNPASRRVPASEIIHSYDMERAGQDRGPSWLASATVNIKDFDEFEDAQLMRQKIAALFAAFVSDPDGPASALGETSVEAPLVETLEPGLVNYLKPGQEVTFGNPPLTTDDGFSARALRRIAASIGVTYEDLTGDYSQVNFSSARMSRLAHWGNVYDWQWNMLIPQFCTTAWGWAMEAAVVGGVIEASERPGVEWTPMPMPMTEPDREARANVIMIRSGQKTLSQVIREQGADPDAHLEEYAADLAKLDAKKIWLDSDVRRVSQAGLTQERAGAGGGSSSSSSSSGEATEPGAEGSEGDE